jgi:hypothetical protein
MEKRSVQGTAVRVPAPEQATHDGKVAGLGSWFTNATATAGRTGIRASPRCTSSAAPLQFDYLPSLP